MPTVRKTAVICLLVSASVGIVCIEVLSRSQQMIIAPLICAVMIFALGIALGIGQTGAGSAGRRSPDYGVVAAKLDEIEEEMKLVGLWQEKPLAPEKYNFASAFAMDTMSFDQWLQFIFVPRVRGIISAGGRFPASSSVGAQAVREFDTHPNAQRLITLLSEFDRLF
jgi:uncharacterized protein YqcC (DUF446 family)